MRKILGGLLGTFFLISNAEAIESDKGIHFGVSATAHAACTTLTESFMTSKVAALISCWVLVNSAGIVKEISDPERGGQREYHDLAANAAGSSLSLLAISITGF